MLLVELDQLHCKLNHAERFDLADDAFFEEYDLILANLLVKRRLPGYRRPLFRPWHSLSQDPNVCQRQVIDFVVKYRAGRRTCLNQPPNAQPPAWLLGLPGFDSDAAAYYAKRFAQARGALGKAPRLPFITPHGLTVVFCDQLEEPLRAWLTQTLCAPTPFLAELHEDVHALLAAFGPDCVVPSAVPRIENRAQLLLARWRLQQYEAFARQTSSLSELMVFLVALRGGDIRTPLRGSNWQWHTSLLQSFKRNCDQAQRHVIQPSWRLTFDWRFPHFSRPERQVLLRVLEQSSLQADELLRYRDRWLWLDRFLHVAEHRKRYPRTHAAFVALRTGGLRSFAGQAEILLARGATTELLNHLSQRPLIFARRLHELLRRFPATETILARFEAVAGTLSLVFLLHLERYFATINCRDIRVAFGRYGQPRLLINKTKGTLTEVQLAAIAAVFARLIAAKLRARDSWCGLKVWIDPALAWITLPRQHQRVSQPKPIHQDPCLHEACFGDHYLLVGRNADLCTPLSPAEQTHAVRRRLCFTDPNRIRRPLAEVNPPGRGSAFACLPNQALRLFVTWFDAHPHIDLDLTAALPAADGTYLGALVTRFPPTNKKRRGNVSQKAPYGAVDVIEVNPQALPAEVAFVVFQVRSSAEIAFSQFPCFVGFSRQRRSCSEPIGGKRNRAGAVISRKLVNPKQGSRISRRAFGFPCSGSAMPGGTHDRQIRQGIRSVLKGATVFPMVGKGCFAVPWLLDRAQNRLIWTDLFPRLRPGENGRARMARLTDLLREIRGFGECRPTYGALAERHLELRGGERAARALADLTIGFHGCDAHVLTASGAWLTED